MSKLISKTVEVVDNAATGAAMRKRREAKGVSLRALAGILKVSPAYLSDLELGRRQWSEERAASFLRALGNR